VFPNWPQEPENHEVEPTGEKPEQPRRRRGRRHKALLLGGPLDGEERTVGSGGYSETIGDVLQGSYRLELQGAAPKRDADGRLLYQWKPDPGPTPS
jgi:hypothetical protein